MLRTGKERLSSKAMLFFFFIIFMLQSVLAASPFQASSADGLTIVTPLYEKIPQNTNRTVYWEVYNSSSNIEMTNRTVNCTFILYYYGDGSQVYKQNGTFSSDIFKVYLDGKNFSKTGIYSKHISCNTHGAGGFAEFEFVVEPVPLTSNETVTGFIISILILLPILLGFIFIKAAKVFNEDNTAFRIMFILLGITTFFVSTWIGTLALGNFYTFSTFSDAMATITQWSAYIVYALIAIIFITGIFALIDSAMQKRKKENGNDEMKI